MLPGFERYTSDLTDYEKDVLLPLFIHGFAGKIGREKAVTNKEIISKLKPRGFKISDARVRKLINHIRNNNLIPGLIATSEGYYISRDQSEVNKYIESLAGREKAIARIKRGFQEYVKTLV